MHAQRGLVGVIGPGEASAAETTAAEAIGRALAAAGCSVVCGGLGGVMAAACRGVREAPDRQAGVATVGLLPGDDAEAANPWVDVAVPTGLGEGRNLLVVRASRGLIAVGGGYGTLSEIALALKAGKAVVGLGTWELARAGVADEAITVAHDAGQAVELLLEALEGV